MKKLTLIVCVAFALALPLFGGTIMGTITGTGTSTDTAFVLVFHDFASLLDTGIYYTEAYPPSYDWVIDSSALIDGYDYNAMAIIPGSIPPEPGDPAGQYPGNPFQLTGGSATDIDIPLAETGELHGHITSDAPAESLMVSLYDCYPLLMGGTPSLRGSYRVTGYDYSLSPLDSGPVKVMAFADLNGNASFDSTGFYVEPHAWHETEMNDIVPIGGGTTTSVDFVLPPYGIGEGEKLPEAISVNVFPNPFNSSAKIVVSGEGEKLDIGIYDLEGKLVRNMARGVRIDGERAFRFIPSEGLPSGNYLIRIENARNTLKKEIIYVK